MLCDRAPAFEPSRPAISSRSLLRSGTPTAHERVALPLLPSGSGGVRRFSLRGAQPSTPPHEAHSTRLALGREFNPAGADCGLQGTATSPSSTTTPKSVLRRRSSHDLPTVFEERHGCAVAVLEIGVRYTLDVVVLDGEVAVPCSPQSAPAGSNSRLRASRVE